MMLDMELVLMVLMLLWSSGLQAEEIHNDKAPVRLVGGSSRCTGRLEMEHQAEWRPVYRFNWGVQDSAKVCRELDCGPVVSTGEKTDLSPQSVWTIRSYCVEAGIPLRACVQPGKSKVTLEVTCSESVRLVNGPTRCSGRLEVRSNQTNQRWTSVCEDDFDQQDAEVVCRELDCGAPSVLQGALYGEVEASMWTKEFQCGGHESALLDCRRSDSVRNSCSPGRAAGLTCSEPVRLVGGSSRCSGTLEIKHQNEWRPVDESDWTLKEATAACRQLDCGSAISVQFRDESVSRTGPLRGIKQVWRTKWDCVQNGDPLSGCIIPSYSSTFMEITCSDSVRLVDGPSPCSGRLEVKSNQSNQSWSSVCEADFDQQDAEVVCRELGCGPPSVLQGALNGEVEASMWTKEFQCGGHESALLDCRRSDSARNTCSPGRAAGLTCSDSVRLVGGSSRCSGTLEIKHGEWRPVYRSDWTLKEAAVFCRKLDCGSIASMEMKMRFLPGQVWEISASCVHSASPLGACVRSSSSSFSLEVTCSDSVRLVDGHSLCSGRLEVKSDQSNQSWSSVCEDDFDQQDAEVVCRELGCGPPSVLQGALYGEVEASTWTKEFQCGGHESALLDCRGSDSVRNTCSPGRAAGLTCSDPVRLVGGSSRCNGTLEVKVGKWRPVCDSNQSLKKADTFCRKLDCGSAVSMKKREGSFGALPWAISSDCNLPESSLRDCVKPDSDSSDFILEVTCSDSVRLVDGPSLCSGRLEVKSNQSNQSWSSVCEADFDQQDAEVVCRELGCGPPSVLQGALYGEVEAPMWTKEFQCGGHESALLDCRRSDSARNTCSPGRAVGLTCSEPVRLVGGSSRCSGTLEIKHQNEWRPASDLWRMLDGFKDTLCSLLHCGSAVSMKVGPGSSVTPVWGIRLGCSHPDLKSCVEQSSSSSRVVLTCSDLLV